MEYKELRKISKSPAYELPFPLKVVKRRNGLLSINKKVLFPVVCVKSSFSRSVYPFVNTPDQRDIAVLCFTKSIEELDVARLTEDQFLCYIFELDLYLNYALPYQFKYDYLVVREDWAGDYVQKYKESSALWGGFVHADERLDTIYTKVENYINIPWEMNSDGPLFFEKSIQACFSANSIDRFLKLYHLVELVFDYDLVKKIKAMDVEKNSHLIGQMLNSYRREDIERLNYIVRENCSGDFRRLENKINNIIPFFDKAEKLFYTFGKESNPLKSFDNFKQVFGTLGGISEVNLDLAKIQFNKNYPDFLCKITSYWIYRVRSSIAHSKIGEYVLPVSDEEFIVEFAEPLLLEVLFLCYRK